MPNQKICTNVYLKWSLW